MTTSKKNGIELLRDPSLNKSTAFTLIERAEHHLEGLLPFQVETEEMQFLRINQQLSFKTSNLERYIFLINLLEQNETLFYKVLMSDPARFLPIVYDPTVGEACLKFSHIFRHPRGLFISLKHKGKIKEVFKNWPKKDVRVICVTSGERILGLGDLGLNGMGIPIGKLMLYTACAAVPPDVLLPVHVDLGTNNQALLKDPLYLGIKKNRLDAHEVDNFMDEFVEAVQEAFPGCCIHFEDWSGVDAMRLLARYRDKVSCYNDDIQGTAGVTLCGLFSAMRVLKSKLSDQRILFLGAGSAGVGIANLLVSSMQLEGLARETALEKIALFDIHGLIQKDRKDLFDFQKPYAHPMSASDDLIEVIKKFKPTALIGVSTKGGAFNQKVIEAMCEINPRPIIFALSNPTEHAECTAEEAYKFSNGKALFAAGVPFNPVKVGNQTFIPGQGNNLYIFPAVGLAVYATKAKRVPDELFITAAKAVAEMVSNENLTAGLLFPPQADILKTEIKAACEVAKVIFDKNIAGITKPDSVEKLIESSLYSPKYP
jgi:malate dehydrogenase (oxaloacetate-decarboxylating)(NADP+)